MIVEGRFDITAGPQRTGVRGRRSAGGRTRLATVAMTSLMSWACAGGTGSPATRPDVAVPPESETVSADGATEAETPRQRAATDFVLPATGPATFAPAAGPRVGIDEAHQNYHTADGRYRSFAALLRRDGYPVVGFDQPLDAESLAGIDILVISNAIAPENVSDWSLPNHPAFGPDEVAAAEAWVRGGGSLLLIADHMPMPGATAALARAFGVLFHDGFAYDAEGESRLTFRREDGSLARHEVTSDRVQFVTTFTGQAFRLAPGVDADPLLHMPTGAYLLLPRVAWEFPDDTPRIAADGMLQGALIRHGAGRVAVFGEAAAFSAQVSASGNPMGMNHPRAPHNARFLLNVIRWLAHDERQGGADRQSRSESISSPSGSDADR